MSDFQAKSDVLFDDLLANKEPLETLMDHREFLNEVYMQNEDLFSFMSSDSNLEKLLQYLYFPNVKQLGQKKACQYSFLSYSALSDCEPTLTEKIILNKKYLDVIFCLIKDKKENNLTARGYFQGIMKNFISELNPFLPGFIKTLKVHAEDYIFPLVRNLTRANCEIIKDILASQNEKLKKLQLCIFEYLLFYFLNEQFDKKNMDLDQVFSNLVDIFQFLKTLDVVYNYKLKYEYTLYSEEYVKNNSLKEPIYYFKLILLNYIAYTGQIKTAKSPQKFIQTLDKHNKSKRSFFYKLEMMKFFKILSNNEQFHNDVDAVFVQRLLNLLEKEKGRDILHNQIFQILQNLAPRINSDAKILEVVAKFIQKCHLNLKMPQEQKKKVNSLSLDHIYKLSKLLDLEKLKKNMYEEVQNYRDLLSTIFTQLCAEEVNSTISDIQELSEVQYVIKNDFGNLNKDRQILPEDDARFHYEDDILEPEPLINNSENKLQTRKSFQKNLTLDSEISDLKEPENEEEHYEKLILSQNESSLDDNLSYRFENKSGVKSQVKSELLSPNTSGLENEKIKFGKKDNIHQESISKKTQFNQKIFVQFAHAILVQFIKANQLNQHNMQQDKFRMKNQKNQKIIQEIIMNQKKSTDKLKESSSLNNITKKKTKISKSNSNCQNLKELFELEYMKKLSFLNEGSFDQDTIKNWFDEQIQNDKPPVDVNSPLNQIDDIKWLIYYLIYEIVPFNHNRVSLHRKFIMNISLNPSVLSPHAFYNEVYQESMEQLKRVCDFILHKKILIKQDLQILHAFGDWIGNITLQSDRPFYLNRVDLKKQIWKGVQMRFLNNIVLLVCVILKSIKNSNFFTIKNPHVNAVIDILREILQINWALQSTKSIITELFLMLQIEMSQIHFFGYLQQKMQNKDQLEALVDYEFLPDFNKLNLSSIVNPKQNYQKYLEFQQILATSIEQTVKDMVTEYSQHVLDQVISTVKLIGVKDFLGIDSSDVFGSSLLNMFENLTWNIVASLYLDKLESKFNYNLQAIFYQQKLNKEKDFDYVIRKMNQENIQYLTTLFRDNFLRIGFQLLQGSNWYKKNIQDRKKKDKNALAIRKKDLKWLESQLPKTLNIVSKSQEIVDVEIYQKLSQEESLKIAPYELNPFMLWVKDQTEFYNEWESNVIIDLILEIDSILSNTSLDNKSKISKTQNLYYKIKKKLLQIQNNSLAVNASTEHILKKLFVSVQQNITVEKIKVYRDLLALLQTQWQGMKDKVTQWVFQQKSIKPQIFVQLIKKGLVNLKLFDELLKVRIEKNQNQGLEDFVIICKMVLIDEKVFEIFQFPKTLNLVVDMVQNNLVQSDHYDVVMFLEVLIKNIQNPNKLNLEIQLSSLELEYQKLQKDVQEYFEILNEEIYQQMANTLNNWIMKKSSDQVTKIIMDFHRNIYIKNKRTFSLFFCYLFEQGINDSIKKSTPNQIQNFGKFNFDLVDVINTFILRLIQASPNQHHILELIMTPLIILFSKFYNFGEGVFNQKPFFYIIWNLIRGISTIHNTSNFKKFVVIFNQTLHILRPSKFPKFAFAWLHLISDQFLIQNSLTQQQNWIFYYKLLIDLLLFIKKDLNNDLSTTQEGQAFLNGVLKLFLVMAISYQEFLYYYFYQLLEEMPRNFLQLRNILLRIYPARTELPTPFQQDLWRVQNQIQFREIPKITPLIEQRMQASDLDICVENYLNLENHDDPLEKLEAIYEKFFYESERKNKHNELLISSFVIYLPILLLNQVKQEKQVVFNMKQNKSFELMIKIFEKQNHDLNELVIDEILDNLRYPNQVTFYYSNFVLLYMQEFKDSCVVELMVTRLLGRLYVHGPHPWGLLFLFFQMIANPIIEATSQNNFQRCQPSL